MVTFFFTLNVTSHGVNGLFSSSSAPASAEASVTEKPSKTPAPTAANPATETPTVPAAPAQTPESIAAANGVPEGYVYYRDGFYKGDPKKLAVGDVRV